MTIEILDEISDYINHLYETVGLKSETLRDFNKVISKERDKLKLTSNNK